MDWIFPDEGGVYWLQKGVSAGVNYHLRANSWTITLGDSISQYDEPSNSGYAPISVAANSFSTTGVTNHLAFVQAPTISFSCTAGTTTVYGVYATDPANTMILASATFDQQQTFSSGTPIAVTPVFGQESELSS